MKHNMSDEKKPNRKKLLPEGWRIFSIVNGKEATSKSGNAMIIFTIQDGLTGYQEDIYAVAEPKKRWFLKSILAAVGCEASQDGVYDWEFAQVINKEFEGLVEHEPNDFINREGETIKTTQHRIVDVGQVGKDVQAEEPASW